MVLDSQLVWKYFGDPDDWDPTAACIPLVARGNEYKSIGAKDMFPYISSA